MNANNFKEVKLQELRNLDWLGKVKVNCGGSFLAETRQKWDELLVIKPTTQVQRILAKPLHSYHRNLRLSASKNMGVLRSEPLQALLTTTLTSIVDSAVR